MSKHAYGTTLTWDSIAIAGLTNINGVEVTADTVDVSTHDSTSAYKEFVVGMLDGGEVTLEGYFDYTDTTGQHAMFTDMAARASKTGIITFPSATGTTWTFTAVITGLKIGDAPVDGVLAFTATLKITGVPVLAVAASAGMSALSISESAVVTPTFAIGTFSYVATVLSGVESVTATPTAAAGVITVNGNTVATTEASSAITLGAAGTNTTITIIVTETGKSPKTYTITVARAA